MCFFHNVFFWAFKCSFELPIWKADFIYNNKKKLPLNFLTTLPLTCYFSFNFSLFSCVFICFSFLSYSLIFFYYCRSPWTDKVAWPKWKNFDRTDKTKEYIVVSAMRKALCLSFPIVRTPWISSFFSNVSFITSFWSIAVQVTMIFYARCRFFAIYCYLKNLSDLLLTQWCFFLLL